MIPVTFKYSQHKLSCEYFRPHTTQALTIGSDASPVFGAWYDRCGKITVRQEQRWSHYNISDL